MTVVIGASFAVHVSADVDGEASVAAAVSLVDEGLIAPPIFWHEVASALRSLRLRRVLGEGARDAAWRSLQALGIALQPSTPDIRAVIDASTRYQLTIYDAAYLELALRTGSRLATRDNALAAAAARAGVETVGR